MSNTFGSVTSLLKMYVKTLIMDPKQLESLLQPNVHGHAYFGWHCWRPSGCLWSSLFPHTTRYSTSISRELTKVIFQNKFSDTLRHFQLTQLTSSSCPRPLLPRSQSFSLFLWAATNWPIMTTFTNLYFLDNQYFLVDFECPHNSYFLLKYKGNRLLSWFRQMDPS